MIKALTIFSGNANRELSESICRCVEVRLGAAEVTTFSDGEIFTEINENVRGVNCFVVQPTCLPVNQNLMELLVMIGGAKRGAGRIDGRGEAVLRVRGQDRKVKPRTPISAKLVADLITAAGADRVVTVDLHAGQIQGFFNIPVDHLYALPVLLDYITKKKINDLVIVSPDAGGVERARAFAKRLQASLAIIDKRREGPNQTHIMNIIGDVEGKIVLLLDDMIDTAGTIVQGAQACADKGAREVWTACTHAVLTGPALERLQQSCLKQVIVTDTIPLRGKEKACPKLHQ